MPEQPLLDFDGATYEPEHDSVRLTGQMLRVFEVMKDGRWHSLAELADRAAGSEAGVSARIRDLRKKRFGGHEVERKRIDGGLWWYRLVLTDYML